MLGWSRLIVSSVLVQVCTWEHLQHTQHCAQAEGTMVCKNSGVSAFGGRGAEEKGGQITPRIEESFLEEVTLEMQSWGIGISRTRPKRGSGEHRMGKGPEGGWQQILLRNWKKAGDWNPKSEGFLVLEEVTEAGGGDRGRQLSHCRVVLHNYRNSKPFFSF